MLDEQRIAPVDETIRRALDQLHGFVRHSREQRSRVGRHSSAVKTRDHLPVFDRCKIKPDYAVVSACHAALVQLRWPDGFECPDCRGHGHCLVN